MRYDRVHELKLRYDVPDHFDEQDLDDPFAAADLALTRNIATHVNDTYPGHPWFIKVSHHQGIVQINLPALMRQHYYIVPIRDLHTDPGFKKVLKGCGEILERYGLPRAGFSMDQYLAALAFHPTWKKQNTSILL